MRLIIIAAIAANNIIGDSKKGLPWSVPEEFRHFKDTTFGHPIIMGRTTWMELGKPLPGRLNIVLSKEPVTVPEDVLAFSALASALDYCRSRQFECVFIIGGRTVYESCLPIVDEMILTSMNFNAEGDIAFPAFDINDWDVERTDVREKFTITYYKRKVHAHA